MTAVDEEKLDHAGGVGCVERRYQAVLEVLGGVSVIEVARRFGVVRQTVQGWLRRYASDGLAGLADRSSRPLSCPHQMAAEVEVRSPSCDGPIPPGGRGPSVFTWRRRACLRCLPVRRSTAHWFANRLLDPKARRKRRSDYKRWERGQAMELWQMDVMGGVWLSDGSELKVVTGIDDNSRFCVSALLVRLATARPVCGALAVAMRAHGVPDQILTDNGKVFTGRFGPGKGEVLFDRICRENGIRHLLTAPPVH